MFKKYLSYEMPAMYRKGQSLFFLNSKDKKMEELKVVTFIDKKHYFLNGKDVTIYYGETTNQWLSRVFDLKYENEYVSSLVNFILPKAEAQFWFGMFLGATVASGVYDSQRSSTTTYIIKEKDPTLESLQNSPQELARLKGVVGKEVRDGIKEELQKAFPNQEKIAQAKREMWNRVVTGLRSNMEIQCLPGEKGQYSGAKFTSDIGKKVVVTSSPQNEMHSMNVTVQDVDNENNKFVIQTNAATQNSSGYRVVDGKRTSLAPGSKQGQLSEFLSAPFVEDKRIAQPRSVNLNEEEADKISGWISKSPQKEDYALCTKLADGLFDYHGIKFGEREDKYNYDRDYSRVSVMRSYLKETNYKEMNENCKTLRDRVAVLENYKGGRDFWSANGIQARMIPFTAPFEKDSELRKKLTDLDAKVEKMPSTYRALLTPTICSWVENVAGQNPVDNFKTSFLKNATKNKSAEDLAEQRQSERYRILNSRVAERDLMKEEIARAKEVCDQRFLSKFDKENPAVTAALQKRSQDYMSENTDYRTREQSYKNGVSRVEDQMMLADAATACCRDATCADAIKAEETVRKNGQGSGTK